MKRSFFLILFSLLLAGGASAMDFDSIFAMDCDSWAAGYIEAYETYNVCLTADEYNTTYHNLVAYCEEF